MCVVICAPARGFLPLHLGKLGIETKNNWCMNHDVYSKLRNWAEVPLKIFDKIKDVC